MLRANGEYWLVDFQCQAFVVIVENWPIVNTTSDVAMINVVFIVDKVIQKAYENTLSDFISQTRVF